MVKYRFISSNGERKCDYSAGANVNAINSGTVLMEAPYNGTKSCVKRKNQCKQIQSRII